MSLPRSVPPRPPGRRGARLGHGPGRQGEQCDPEFGECSGTLRMLDANAWLSVGPLLEEIVQAVVAPLRRRGQAGARQGASRRSSTRSMPSKRCAWPPARPACRPPHHAVAGRGGLLLVPRARPGAMARLGTRTPGPTYDLHQGDLVVDEDAVLGARLLALSAVVTRVKASA